MSAMPPGDPVTLFVEQLRLQQFRSHDRCTLAFDGRPVAIYGDNGAGKTNLIEAVSLLSPGRGLRRASPAELVRRQHPLGWKIHAVVRRGADRHEIETGAAPDQSRSTRVDEKAAPQTALGRITGMLWLVPAMDRIWIEGAEGRRRFLDRMTLSFAPDHGASVLAYEKAMRERNRLLRDQVQDRRWYEALEARMAETGARIDASRAYAVDQITAAQQDAVTSFPVADLQLLQGDGTNSPRSREMLADAFAASRASDLRAGRSLTGPHRADLAARYAAKDMSAAQCSTGEQKALLISLVLAAGRALTRSGNPPPILLLDEVAAHLDMSRRAALFDEICTLGSQAWMTGTEPALFETLGSRAQWLSVSEQDGGSVVAAAAPQP